MNVVDDKANDYLQFASSFIKHQLDSNPSRNVHTQYTPYFKSVSHCISQVQFNNDFGYQIT